MPHLQWRQCGDNLYHVKVGAEEIYIASQTRIANYRFGIAKRNVALAKQYGAANLGPQMCGKVVIDVGANVGEFSRFAAAFEAKVHAIEPDPLAFAALKKNAKGRGIKCHRLALWKENATLPLTLMTNSADSNVLPIGAESTLQVKGVTLKRFMDVLKLDDVFLLKADCEGAEPEMLEGAGDALRRISYITIDCGPERYHRTTVDECAAILKRWGFEVNRLNQKRVVLFCKRT